MRTVIVPNDLRDAIHAAITKALNGRPCTDADRETLYQQLLAYFDEHGRLPDFKLSENVPPQDAALTPSASAKVLDRIAADALAHGEPCPMAGCKGTLTDWVRHERQPKKESRACDTCLFTETQAVRPDEDDQYDEQREWEEEQQTRRTEQATIDDIMKGLLP